MLTSLLLCLLQQGAPAPPTQWEEIPLALRVNRSIALGVDYLKRLQLPDGSFAGQEGIHQGGMTALVAFTLVKSGVRHNDPALLRALEALEGNVFRSTYAASVHLLLCEALAQPKRRAEAQTSLDFLLANQESGVWGYPGLHLCNSNTQFALLGLRAGHHLGLEVPEEAWIDAVDGLRMFQDRSGGFQYKPGERPEPYAGMTSAALASWAVLEEMGRESAKVRAALVKRAELQKGAEDWLEHHFDLTQNQFGDGSWTNSWHAPYLWAVERWCGLTGRKSFAGHDWYEEGARFLIEGQAHDGSWPATSHPTEDTCFALLFLRRATLSPDGELDEIYAEIERLRAQRPERFVVPGPDAARLCDWLLAGPWLQSGGAVLLLEPPFDPADAKPKLGGRLDHREWERVTLSSQRWTDLDALTPRKGDEQLWAIATTLVWEPAAGSAAPFEGDLWLDFEDGWDVWLDGQRLSRERRRATAIRGDVRFPLTLTPGEHPLLVLVEDRAGAAAFGARVTDRANQAPPAGLFARAVPAKH
ncbi:MAG: hypothetical protein EXS08_16730 [Planctomycetes bacterium]|nr:hypothetical protein [Planctomycetota bacterium]